MKITSMEEYGLRCIMQLAVADRETPVAVSQIAENEGLSNEYAGKLLNLLRQAGLVESIRGRNGGFVLAAAPDEISVAQVVQVFSPEMFDDDYCARHTGNEDTCVHHTACSLRSVWWTLSEVINRTLDSITLMDLMCGEAAVEKELRPQLDAVGAPTTRHGSPIQITEGA